MKLKKMSLAVMLSLFILAPLVSTGLHGADKKAGTILTDPAPNKDGKIKILLLFDMEGVSGQNDMRSLSARNKEYYEPVRELLTKDVNAVVDGLFAGGADEVHIVDGHGSGNPEPDVLLDKLDKRAQIVVRDERFSAYMDLVEKDVFDAVALVAMHSKTGGGGFAAHTYTIGTDWIINDKSINETEIVAYAWGQIDVPVIFTCGDDKLKEQLAFMTWLEYVTVKYAKGASDAELRPLEEVYKELRAGAKRAVENLGKAKAIKPTLPIKAQLRAFHPAKLNFLKNVPGVDCKDNTVTFEAASYKEAYDGITGLIDVATRGYWALIFEVIRKQENREDIYKAYGELFSKRWVDVESGRWSPPKPPERKKRKYYGY
ncbi:MAG: M55 family metallopeptidase [bacterium]|nr:M55 family metallopeptidase [bacterium]